RSESVLGTPLDTTPRPGRRNRRYSPEERSADIIRVATLLISERGYYGVTLRSVATACDMTLAGLLHYFKGKDDLLIAVLENRDKLDLNQARIDAVEGFVGDPRERLDALVERNSRQPELVRLYSVLNSESLAAGHPAHAYFNERYRYSIGLFARMLDGHFQEPRRVAAQLIGIMDGIQMQWLRFPDATSLVDLWAPLADAVFDTAPRAGVAAPD
ncbi:MAG TPA: TetR/AcrR family transcriptional regulator, partial [Cellulomonas sp.]